MTEVVDHPPHYKSHPSGVECITITEHFNFNLGNAIKYVWRSDEKGRPIEDLEKAVWYIQRELGRRRLLAIEQEHDQLPTEFPALAEYTQAAGGLPNNRRRQSTAEVLPDPHNWPRIDWSVWNSPPEQVYDLYGGNGEPFPAHLPDPDEN